MTDRQEPAHGKHISPVTQGARGANGTEPLSLSVPEMDCPSCAGKVEAAIQRVPGVHTIDTQPAVGRVVVHHDPGIEPNRVIEAIQSAGYPVAERDAHERQSSPHDVWSTRRAKITWLGAAFLIIGLIFEFILDPGLSYPLWGREITLAWLAYTAGAVTAGTTIVRNGFYSVRARSLDIDLLMSSGIIGALLVGLPFEAATLAVLFSIAELLERFSMDRARHSLRELMDLAPDVATVRRDGAEFVVPANAVTPGETVLVRPGERIPLDGIVRKGRSAVDESPITGESIPVDKAPGDEVYAGSITAEGYLEYEATSTASESTIAQVIDLVEDAERAKTQREQFVDRFARYYTPLIVVAAILTVPASIIVFGVTPTEAFVRGLTLLVIACPCAFVISTPVSVVSGITSAARQGVLIKGGNHLETMGTVDTVAIDKTGTLTTGELSVTDVIPLNGNTKTGVLQCARAIEQRSEHPIAAAIIDHATEQGVGQRTVTDFEVLPGKGVKATLDSVTHYAGKPGLFVDLGFDLEHAHVTDGGTDAVAGEHGSHLDLLGQTLPRLQAEGKSVVLVGTATELEGVIAIADTVRPAASATVQRLKALGLRIVMLTGDNTGTANVIAEQVGIEEIRADLLPGQKVTAVRELGENSVVAMVGDGVNDAPALAAADVGIAMGAVGSDAAIETADIALLGDELQRLPYLTRLSRRANGVIRQNIWSSLAVKAGLALGAPLGLVSVITAIVVGDMGMSLAVTGNAMRLVRVRSDSVE